MENLHLKEKTIEKISMSQDALDKFITMCMSYAPKLLLAILTLIVGFWISKRIANGALRIFRINHMEPSLSKWLSSFLSAFLKIIIIISVASMVGIETTSFIALLGAAGLAIGLALQGSLTNFTGGLLILFFKPFKVGDYISAQGEEGTVETIDIFYSYLKTSDNRSVILPNGPLAGGKIINVNCLDRRRVDIEVGISYSSDYKIAAEILTKLALSDQRVFSQPAPFIGVKTHGDNAINLVFRVWCRTPDYWDVFYFLNDNLKKTLEDANISIPFPQREVHVFNTKATN